MAEMGYNTTFSSREMDNRSCRTAAKRSSPRQDAERCLRRRQTGSVTGLRRLSSAPPLPNG